MADWFRSWFDSPYYDLLYRGRDESEARQFVEHLVSFLNLPAATPVLDIACGTGRHSVQLARMGLQVTGVDLSIPRLQKALARKAELDAETAARLAFLEGDMRALGFDHAYAAAFNLFTSLGYFQDITDNLSVLTSVAKALVPGGLLVIDFLNARYVADRLVETESQVVAGVRFEIKRRIERGRVQKAIRVTDGAEIQHFTESVQLLGFRDFERLLKKARFELQHTWGDYAGAPFHEPTSPRLILFAKLPG